MTSRDFAYWLQGFFELSEDNLDYLDESQIKAIKAHLNMVFIHEIDPSFPAHQQDALTEAHEGGKVNFDIESDGLPYNPWLDSRSDPLNGVFMKC